MIKKYDEEFKRNAVKKVLDGQSVRSVSQELGVNESQIHKWRRASSKGKQSETEVREIDALKKRNRELEMENEILKRQPLSSAEEAKTLFIHRSGEKEIPAPDPMPGDVCQRRRLLRLAKKAIETAVSEKKEAG